VKVSYKKWYEECPEKVRNNECGEYEVGGTGLSLDVYIFSVPLDKNVLRKEEENPSFL